MEPVYKVEVQAPVDGLAAMAAEPQSCSGDGAMSCPRLPSGHALLHCEGIPACRDNFGFKTDLRVYTRGLEF